jgi:hypothetical protein
MPPPDWSALVGSFVHGVYNITTHGFQEMGHDRITIETLESSLSKDAPELLEDYPDEDLGPCCLIPAWTPNNVPLHTVIGYGGDSPDVITVYSPPDLQQWESDFRTRRN